MKKVETFLKFENEIDFFSLVTNFDEYQEMVASAKKAGFNNNVDFYYFDNITKNEFDGYSALSHALQVSNAQYLIFCHQDILFNYDGYSDLIECIKKIEKFDENWAVLGNAGRNANGKYYINITDPNGRQIIGDFPSDVMSLDENFLVINNKLNIRCTSTLKGFHLYGTDLCYNANYLGFKNYVINFHVFHKSPGYLNKSFFDSRNDFIRLLQDRKKSQIIFTACTKFYASCNSLLNIIFNYKIINKFLRIIKGME